MQIFIGKISKKARTVEVRWVQTVQLQCFLTTRSQYGIPSGQESKTLFVLINIRSWSFSRQHSNLDFSKISVQAILWFRSYTLSNEISKALTNVSCPELPKGYEEVRSLWISEKGHVSNERKHFLLNNFGYTSTLQDGLFRYDQYDANDVSLIEGIFDDTSSRSLSPILTISQKLENIQLLFLYVL